MAKGKRGNGEGTIYKATVKGKTVWRAQVFVTDMNGNQKRKTIQRAAYAEVKAELDKIKREVATGIYSDAKDTVKAYLSDWLQNKQRELAPGTFKNYRAYFEKHLIPLIGDKALVKLTPLQIQRALATIADIAGIPTANHCRTNLYSALKRAVRLQIIPRNPVEAVDPLKGHKPREQVIWEAGESVRFLDAARAHRLYALFYTSMTTGLRKSELIHLRWDDIQGNKLTVRKSKTPKGHRRVTLSPDVLGVLEEHRQRQEAEKAFFGETWPDTGLVFTTQLGTKLQHCEPNRVQKMLEKQAGVRHATVHDLRHLNVSLRRKMGQDAKLIADQIGHKDPAFTTRTYTHFFDEDREAAAIDLSVALGSSTPVEARN